MSNRLENTQVYNEFEANNQPILSTELSKNSLHWMQAWLSDPKLEMVHEQHDLKVEVDGQEKIVKAIHFIESPVIHVDNGVKPWVYGTDGKCVPSVDGYGYTYTTPNQVKPIGEMIPSETAVSNALDQLKQDGMLNRVAAVVYGDEMHYARSHNLPTYSMYFLAELPEDQNAKYGYLGTMQVVAVKACDKDGNANCGKILSQNIATEIK
jgi:hypothetical protein